MRYGGAAIIGIGFSFTPHIHAQVISEVFFSPASKQWIEVYNNTSGDIDLTQYKILDSGAAVNGHSISVASVSSVIPAGAYGVVAKDLTGVSSQYLFKSSLGIKVTGDNIILKNGSVVISSLVFPDGSFSSGNSYQNIDSNWIFSSPTPGAANIAMSDISVQGSSDVGATTAENNSKTQAIVSTALSSHYAFVPLSVPLTDKFVISVGRDRLGYVGVPLVFKAIVNTDDPNTSYVWNFGDGSSEQGRDSHHVYLYPGIYTVVLNAELFDNKAVSRAIVRIISPELEVREANSAFVSIKNNSMYEVNLYGWQLRQGKKIFEFPKDTILSSKETIYFPGTVTQLLPIDKGQIVLSKIYEEVVLSKDNTVAFDLSRQRAVEELTLKLSHAQKQLLDLRAQESVAVTESKESDARTALVAESVPHVTNPWFVTLKHFFRFK
jgi:hypothetical protein